LFEEDNCEAQQSVAAHGSDMVISLLNVAKIDGDDVKDVIKNAIVHSHDSNALSLDDSIYV